jgi:hypothetical protein
VLDDGPTPTMLAVWSAGRGQQATTVCRLPERAGDHGAQLCEALTRHELQRVAARAAVCRS